MLPKQPEQPLLIFTVQVDALAPHRMLCKDGGWVGLDGKTTMIRLRIPRFCLGSIRIFGAGQHALSGRSGTLVRMQIYNDPSHPVTFSDKDIRQVSMDLYGARYDFIEFPMVLVP